MARVCEAGARSCDGDVAVVCDTRGSAATSTACAESTDCLLADHGCACVEGDCVARTCVPGATQCVGNATRTCNEMGTGWQPLAPCSDDALCVAGSCIDVVCEPGAVECAGESLATCGDDGTTRDLVDCSATDRICSATADGATCVDRVCAPLAARCATGREAVLTCDARGSAETERPCGADQYCDAGACLPRTCTPGGPICRDGDVQRCNDRGSAWELVTDCRDADCDAGACQFACGDPDIEPNPCGGCEALPLLGTACGPCGLDTYACDGGDAVTCNGSSYASECGGCTPLPLLGTSCGPCGLDEYACDGADGVACDGATRANACGGCSPLPLLGTACGPCGLDDYVCNGPESAACDGSTRVNACGGCTALPLLGTACGPCLVDEYVCDGAEAVECDGATPPSNGCGGCDPLPLLGEPCGPCALDEYVCNGTSSVACDGATPCPLGVLGEACARDADCEFGSCSEESDDPDVRRCVPRLFGSTPTQMDFSYVPPGSFAMGTPDDEVGILDADQVQVTVTLSHHLAVARTEVTQGQWMRAAGATNPSRFTACGDDCPVEMLDWYAAAAYTNWLSNSDGDPQTSPCYTFAPSTCADSLLDWADGDTVCTDATFAGASCTGYRLLTEAEWEYAARAGTTSATYWNPATSEPTGGNLQEPYGCDPQPALEPIAWYCENAGSTTHENGLLLANAWGLFDMLGNAWEWTTDWDTTPLPGGLDPLNPAGSGKRLIRGGSWFTVARGVRVSRRFGFTPSTRVDDVGFRIGRTLPTPPRSVALGDRCVADIDCAASVRSAKRTGLDPSSRTLLTGFRLVRVLP